MFFTTGHTNGLACAFFDRERGEMCKRLRSWTVIKLRLELEVDEAVDST